MLKLEKEFKSSFVPCEIALFKLNAFSLETKKQKSRFDLKILKASHKRRSCAPMSEYSRLKYLSIRTLFNGDFAEFP